MAIPYIIKSVFRYILVLLNCLNIAILCCPLHVVNFKPKSEFLFLNLFLILYFRSQAPAVPNQWNQAPAVPNQWNQWNAETTPKYDDGQWNQWSSEAASKSDDGQWNQWSSDAEAAKSDDGQWNQWSSESSNDGQWNQWNSAPSTAAPKHSQWNQWNSIPTTAKWNQWNSAPTTPPTSYNVNHASGKFNLNRSPDGFSYTFSQN